MEISLPRAVRFLAVVAALVLFAQVGLGAAFVGNIGTATKTQFGNSSLAITVGASGVTAGDSIIVGFASGTFAGAVGCSDTAGNVYNVDADRNNGGSGRVTICSSHGVAALASGDTITVTYPAFSGYTSATANEFSGLLPSGALDQTSTATGNNASPSSGFTAPTSQANELLYGAIYFSGTNFATFTPGAGYTRTNPDLAGRPLASEYQFVSAIGSYQPNGSLSNANQWAAGIATYRESGGGGCTGNLMFVSGQTTGFPPNAYQTLANNDVSYSFANSTAAPNDYALFQTHDPWGGTIVKTAITGAGHTFTVFTPAQLAGFTFSDYRVVVLNWDDTFLSDFLAAYTAAIPALEAYVQGGGVLWIQAAIQGSPGDTYPLPFGGTGNYDLQGTNFIVDTAHPLVAGMPNPFNGNFASHAHFAGLPGAAHVIISTGGAAGGPATLYELKLCP
jgi:hypothetical protein